MADTSPITALSSLQDRFAIIVLSGEIRTIDRLQIADLRSGSQLDDAAIYKRADADLMMRRYLEALPISCNPKQVISDFWIAPSTVVYTATAFTPKATPSSTLNYWIGPVSNAKPGNWVSLRDFLRDVICASDQTSFDYLILFMAHMIQKPEEKPGILVALIGGQGTGKGMFFSLLRAIWHRTTLQVSDVDQVLGRFNAALERNFAICMDEALFAGDKKAMDRLKSLITESVIQIEQKYQPSRSIGSVHRLFASSNHDHFAQVDRDDRRFAFLRVSDCRKQDTTYFSAIAAAICDQTTIGALLYYLQRKDISSFNVRAKPKTSEHLSQKLMSLQGFDRYWYEVLNTGYFNGTGTVSLHAIEEWTQPLFLATETILANYKEFNKNSQRYQTLQSNEIAVILRHLCPSVRKDRQACKVGNLQNGKQLRGFQLPDLATARQEFSDVLGGEIDWN